MSEPAAIIIRRSSGWIPLRFRDLWDQRELLFLLAARDISVRYRQTVLGIAWALIQPVVTMVIFSIVFGRLAQVPSDGLPYPIFVYCALLPWQLFSTALSAASNSLVSNQQLLTKVYFPRLVIPLAAVLVGLVDFGVAFLVLVAMMLYYGIVPTVAVVALPIFVLLALATALAVGLWLCALNVRFRDVRHAIPFLTQAWLFATPIAYPSSLVPESWRALYGLNPMAGVVDGFRWALLGRGAPPVELLVVALVVVGLVMFGGLYYFRRTEQTFADFV